MTLCIGDSITLGIMGYSYIPFAEKKQQLVNLGVNGESLLGGIRRLCRYMKKRAYREADTVIFSLGTNDILLPYLGNRSRFWHIQYRLRNISRRFSSDIGEFAGYYEEAVRGISSKYTATGITDAGAGCCSSRKYERVSKTADQGNQNPAG